MPQSSHQAPNRRTYPPRPSEPSRLSPTTPVTPASHSPALPIFDQSLLNVIHQAFSPTLTSPTLLSDIQRIKSLLYEKRWLEIFTDSSLLEAYACRWVPSRALCYRELISSLPALSGLFAQPDDSQRPSTGSGRDEGAPRDAGTRIVSIGGGAGSEFLAFASILHSTPDRTDVQWTALDIGPWSPIISALSTAVSTAYPSINLTSIFIETDVLLPSSSFPLDSPSLITILFTLTELLSQSRSSTVALLRTLADHPPGTLLLVVDSASDISEFELGSSGRKWPVHMVLDQLVKGEWVVVQGSDSRWFRLGEEVGWRVKLENTRYWYRLYRRV